MEMGGVHWGSIGGMGEGIWVDMVKMHCIHV